MTDDKRDLPDDEAALAGLLRDPPVVLLGPTGTSGLREALLLARDRPLVIIGTSGSSDYLRDAAPDQYRPTRQDRRFWPVSVLGGDPAPGDGACDGLHDEGAPAHHLCTRCFPDLVDQALRGDLVEPQDDEHDDARRDEDPKME